MAKHIQTLLTGALLSVILFGLCPGLRAQEWVDELLFEARGSHRSDFTPGQETSSQFTADYFNFQVRGHITPKLDYRIRQRLNKQVFSAENFLNANDHLWLRYSPNEKWSFTFGKQPVAIGGFEYDAAPIDVYFWSNFCLGLWQYYAMGATVTYNINDEQHILFEICNSPLSRNISNIYAYNLEWVGGFATWWKTLWSVNMLDNEHHRMVNYIMLGNRFLIGNLALDIDIMNRASFQQKQFFLSDWGTAIKAIYSIGKWNLCAKMTHDFNHIDNVAADGIAYDFAVAPGTDFTNAGVGLEFFPFPDREKLRLHLAVYNDNVSRTTGVEAGVTWKMPLISHKK